MKGTASRPYRMDARAESARATGERILDATVEAFWERPTDQLSLDEIARRAGVTVQTVIRRFGGKDELMKAAAERESQRVGSERELAPGAGPAEAVRKLVDHYEAMGDRIIRMLAEEIRVPGLRPIVDRGRVMHREWCARAFPAALEGLMGAERDRRLAQLVAVCDVYVWKLLRRDAGLSRRQTELALLELVTAIMEG
jgi:AcrR family transcriptional regulator